jgi:class 3 adenylate cyclase
VEAKDIDLSEDRLIATAALPSVEQKILGASKLKGNSTRSIIATVLFFDIVGYTKTPVNTQTLIKRKFTVLLSGCLAKLEDGERIILDTGDGAAIGFLQHPEDALEVAMNFRSAVTYNNHQDFPDLYVRIGIHMGPINVVQDMNGQSNMVGDGINDAQRVMSFAGSEQIYVSRAYYDFVSRLSREYDELFVYRGSQKDKHERAHQVYELIDRRAQIEAKSKADKASVAIKLEPFTFEMPPAGQENFAATKSPVEGEQAGRENTTLMADVRKLLETEEVKQVPIRFNAPIIQAVEKVTSQENMSAATPVVNVMPVKTARVIKMPLEASASMERNQLTTKKSLPMGLVIMVILALAAATYFGYIR